MANWLLLQWFSFKFQNCAADHAREYLDSLARLSENQLLQYDNMLVIDDVVKGRKYKEADKPISGMKIKPF